MTYFVKKPTSRINKRAIAARLRGNEFSFVTGSSVFSPKRVDPGSALLINECRIKDGQSVLDLGCGYGPVGIAIKRAFPKTKVTLTDINDRAVGLAKENAKLNKVGVTAQQADGYGKLEKFDVILLNPPQTAGKALCKRLIERAKDHLNPKGNLQIVARHNKGGKSYEAIMEQAFGNVDVVGRQSGYRIYISHV